MKNEAEEWFRELRGRLVSMIEKYESVKFQKKSGTILAGVEV